jgi:hypothetical protein
MILLKGHDAGFAGAILDDFFRSYFAAHENLAQAVVNVVVPGVADEVSSPDYDVVVEVWAGDAALGEISGAEIPGALVRHEFLLKELIEKPFAAPTGGADPGVKVIAGLAPLPGAAPSATRRFWNGHVPLALEIHSGADRYDGTGSPSAARGPRSSSGSRCCTSRPTSISRMAT